MRGACEVDVKRKLPPLNSLRTFEAVGRTGSVAAAARELSVTEPAASRALKNLEAHFGVSLFYRHARGLKLSEHGKVLLPHISDALTQIARASSLIYEKHRYSLSLLTTPMIASHWLGPLIGNFMSENPDIGIHLHSSFRREEIQNYDFDLAIWSIKCDRPGWEREHLLSADRIPICAKSYADANLTGKTWGELEDCNLLHEYDYDGWSDLFLRAGLDPRRAVRGFVSDNFNAILLATLHGAGVGLLFEAHLSFPLYRDLLCAPFGRRLVTETDYWLYSRSGAVDDRPIKRMKAFLKDRLGGGAAPPIASQPQGGQTKR
jgi:LysR family glycine cleavage system transcriptional activator